MLNLIILTIPTLNSRKADIDKLSEYAVETRYLGRQLTDADADHTMNTCKIVRQEIRKNLNMSIE